MPIALLVEQGYSFVYTFALTLGFDLLFAVILFFMLPIHKKQWLRIFPAVLLIAFILRQSHVLSYLFGGL